MRFTMTAFTIVAALTLTGCGDSGSGPSVSLAGNWSYSTSNLSGSGLSCSSGGTTMTITQQGSTFSGSYSGGTLTCNSSSGTASGAIGSGSVVSGSLNGNNLTFDLDTSDWRNTGSISGNSMSGTVLVRIVVSGTTHTLTGAFGAARL